MILSEIMGNLMKISSLIVNFGKPTQYYYRLDIKGLLITKRPSAYGATGRSGDTGGEAMTRWTHSYLNHLFLNANCMTRVAPHAVYIHHDSMPGQRPNKHQANLKPLERDPKQAIPTPESIISNMFTMLGS